MAINNPPTNEVTMTSQPATSQQIEPIVVDTTEVYIILYYLII